MGRAVLAAQYRPLGEYRQTAQSAGAGSTYHSIRQNPVVERHVDTEMVPVKGYGFHVNVRMDQVSTANPDTGGTVQDTLDQ